MYRAENDDRIHLFPWIRYVSAHSAKDVIDDLKHATTFDGVTMYYCKFSGMNDVVCLSGMKYCRGSELWFEAPYDDMMFISWTSIEALTPRQGDGYKCLDELFGVCDLKGYNAHLGGGYNKASRALCEKLGMTQVSWAHLSDIKQFVHLAREKKTETQFLDKIV